MSEDVPTAITVSPRPRRWFRRALIWFARIPARISDKIFGPPGPHDWMI